MVNLHGGKGGWTGRTHHRSIRATALVGSWFWSSETGAPARRVRLPGLPGLEHAEGICPAVLDGRQCLVIVSDDGKRGGGRYAQYLVLDLATSGLTIDP